MPQEDAKRMRGFSGRVLAMKVGLEMSAKKFSFCSYSSQGKMTLRAHFSVKQEAAWLFLLETRQEDPGCWLTMRVERANAAPLILLPITWLPEPLLSPFHWIQNRRVALIPLFRPGVHVCWKRCRDGTSRAEWCPGVLAGRPGSCHWVQDWSMLGWAGLAACRLLLRAQSSKFPACYGCNTKIVSPNIVFAHEGCNSNSMFL